MLHLGFACEWTVPRTKTWSGTPQGLVSAFEQIDTIQLHPIDVELSKARSIAHKIAGLTIRDGSLVTRYRFLNAHLSALQQSYRNACEQVPNLDAILQIGDLGVNRQPPYFSYQDLSVAYLLEYLRSTGKPLYSFTAYSEQDVVRRLAWQTRFYAEASGVFTMSHWLRNFLIQQDILPAERVHTVHAGINVQTLPDNVVERIRSGKRDKMILFVGREFERKGGDSVVRAFELASRRYAAPLRLVIAGPATLLMQMPDGVEFLGDVPYSALSPYFAEADVFCLPSRFEAFGIVFVEALAAGTPCIGRNAYAMPEMIRHGENGLLLENNHNAHDEAELLADLILQALETPALRERAWAERDTVKNYYSWNRVAHQMSEIITNTLA